MFLGQIVKHGDIKCVLNEGMPIYRRPYEKGRLIIEFKVSLERFVHPQMATHCSILAWRSPWTEEPCELHKVQGITKSDTTESD